MVIIVLGVTGSGKTTFISRILGQDVGIGHGLVSGMYNHSIPILPGARTSPAIARLHL